MDPPPPSFGEPLWRGWYSKVHRIIIPNSKTKCDAALSPPPLLPPPSSSLQNDDKSPSMPSVPPIEPGEQTTKSSKSTYRNPGLYEMVPLETKALCGIDTFDGFRCNITKQLSPYMAVIHMFWLGTSMIPNQTKSYTFISQVANDSFLAMARVDPENLNVNGKIHANLAGFATAKVQLGVSGGDGSQDQLMTELDLMGETFTSNLKYGAMGGGVLLGVNYLQAITSRLALGAEGMYITANQNMLSSYMLKYTSALPEKETATPEEELVLNYSTAQNQLNVLYKRIVSPPNRVVLGAELSCIPFMLDPNSTTVSFGAEFQLQRSKMNVCIDGNGKISSTLDCKLGMAPNSPALNFSADLDFQKDSLKFGYGLSAGG